MDFAGRNRMVRTVQDHLGLVVDGKDGIKTWGGIVEALGVKAPASKLRERGEAEIPADRESEIRRVYGRPGDESALVRFKFPYRMRLYNTQRVIQTHRCHRLCKTDLEGILETARDRLGLEFLQEHALDTFYGVYENREMRGRSRARSRHSWGIAIDLAAHLNGFNTPWPSKATMPVEFIWIIEEFGWKSGGHAWGKDAMHFQRTK